MLDLLRPNVTFFAEQLWMCPSISHEIRLRDGRTLAYAEHGDPHGVPIIRCHGAPSSRLEGEILAASFAELGARVIVPDRPGMGRSDFQPHRAIRHWPEDVLQLADALELDRFSVLGVSGGAPYALACGIQLRARVRTIGLVSAVAPFDAPGVFAAMKGPSRMMYQLARDVPWAVRGLLPLMARALQRGSHTSERMAASFPEPDRRIFQQLEFREHFAAVFREAFRRGSRGAVWDMGLIAREWDSS
jgi:pimeloyl-ACP methyl ester carboxylesterase